MEDLKRDVWNGRNQESSLVPGSGPSPRGGDTPTRSSRDPRPLVSKTQSPYCGPEMVMCHTGWRILSRRPTREQGPSTNHWDRTRQLKVWIGSGSLSPDGTWTDQRNRHEDSGLPVGRTEGLSKVPGGKERVREGDTRRIVVV